jgi:ATP-binding cassette subfamily B protein/subfamily B ATP-binding cassette protein MsbA
VRLLLRTLPYLRPHRGLAILSVVVLILDTVVDLLAPWTVLILMDHVFRGLPPPSVLVALFGAAASEPRSLLLVVVVGMIVMAIVNHGLTVFNTFLQATIEQRMILRFRADLFQHVQRLSLSFHDKQRAGDMMFRINNSAASVGEVPMMVPQLAQAALTLVGMFIVVLSLNPTLAVLSMVVAPVLWFAIRSYARHVTPRLTRAQTMEVDSLNLIHEAVSMLRVIIAFGREGHEHRRFSEQGKQAVDARVRVTVMQTLFTMAVAVTTVTGSAVVLGYGALQVLQGQLTVGQMMVVMAYVASVYGPLSTIAGATGPMLQQRVNLERAFELLDADPEVKDHPNAVAIGRSRGHVEFRDVSFSYPGRTDTLKDISFEVRPGQTVAIVGPTGAGKTTLISLLPRFYDPESGTILLDGYHTRHVTLASLRQQFSVVLQEPLLFSATIAENIQYGRLDASMDEVEQAARDANAYDFIARLPQGFDTILGERGSQLSGGERQRIAVARAFLKDAPILILDEPTSSIDSRTESVILDALERLVVGRTSFMIAHRLSTVRHADLIVVLEHGRIVEHGTHAQLLERGGVYRQMYDTQAREPGKAEPVRTLKPGPGMATVVIGGE